MSKCQIPPIFAVILASGCLLSAWAHGADDSFSYDQFPHPEYRLDDVYTEGYLFDKNVTPEKVGAIVAQIKDPVPYLNTIIQTVDNGGCEQMRSVLNGYHSDALAFHVSGCRIVWGKTGRFGMRASMKLDEEKLSAAQIVINGTDVAVQTLTLPALPILKKDAPSSTNSCAKILSVFWNMSTVTERGEIKKDDKHRPVVGIDPAAVETYRRVYFTGLCRLLPDGSSSLENLTLTLFPASPAAP